MINILTTHKCLVNIVTRIYIYSNSFIPIYATKRKTLLLSLKIFSMGCNASKSNTNATMRMLEYEHIAANENSELKVIPSQLDNEEWRDGLISARTLFNIFHAGFCSAYIQNIKYLLLLDFRSVEDWIVERVYTSQHYDKFSTNDKRCHECLEYSVIVLYDSDGTSVGNIRSPLRKTYLKMKSAGLDPRILLGGLAALQTEPYSSLLERPRTIPFAVALQPTVHNSLESIQASEDSDDSFTPDLEEVSSSRIESVRRSIVWQPSMILEKRIYLGSTEQASNPHVMHSLGITHVLSTSRVKPVKFRGIVYILVNKASFSNSTLKLTTNFITEAVNKGGRVLVHGCDGHDQSAAVVIAALMRIHSATLEDCLWYLCSSRPGVNLSPFVIRMLSSVEEEMFGKVITEIDSLWLFDE